MLTRDERQSVEDEFARVLDLRGEPRNLLEVIFGVESPGVLKQIPLNVASSDEYAGLVVGYCIASRWTATPALLDLLLDYLVTTMGIGRFQPLLFRVRRQEDPNPSPYETVWLTPALPFFDRADLRRHVRSLVEENARPLLRVKAQPESFGRTYSRRFLQHLEDLSPDDTHVLAEELSPGTGPSYEVADLAVGLTAQLGVTEAIPPRSGSSYAKAMARWVLKHIMGRGGRWLIVLDGFGQTGLHPEVREMVEALASLIPTGQYRQRVRLVLLDYSEELPSVSTADILEEVLEPPEGLTQKDLEPCINEWDKLRRDRGVEGIPPDDILSLAAGMIQRAPVAGKGRLESLNHALSNLQLLPETPAR